MLGATSGVREASASAVARDRELLRLAARGDADAFDALIRGRLDRLFRMAMAITRSETDAKDATQEACVLAWRELPRLRDPARFDAWVSQILVNAARGVVRRAGRARVREISVDAGSSESPLPSGPAVESSADALVDADAIRGAFARLDATTRTLLALHYVEDKPLAEIARLTGSPVGTVKWRLSNARRALERALEAETR